MKAVQLALALVALVSAAAAFPSFHELEALRVAALERHAALRDVQALLESTSDRLLNANASRPTITFRNPKAAQYFVDGSPGSIPEVNFDVGPSWSGASCSVVGGRQCADRS